LKNNIGDFGMKSFADILKINKVFTNIFP